MIRTGFPPQKKICRMAPRRGEAEQDIGKSGRKKRPHVGIAVTVHSSCMPFPSTVQIVPPVVTLGMGCRKGKEADAVYEAAKACLERASVYRKAVERLASIDLKKKRKDFWLLPQDGRSLFPFSVKKSF